MHRAYYSASVVEFLSELPDSILGNLVRQSEYDVNLPQRQAWLAQIQILQSELASLARHGVIHMEYVLPRLGRRIDTVLIVDQVVFVLEFKVGDRRGDSTGFNQVWDYALDLKNFHETSRHVSIVPVLIPSELVDEWIPTATFASDLVAEPAVIAPHRLRAFIDRSLAEAPSAPLKAEEWIQGRYCPTPTIVEAATALYAGHSVEEISRSGAGETNLSITSAVLDKLIGCARDKRQKVLCLITGVPGAGKTLVGLDLAHRHRDAKEDLHSVFLSGNGPLVSVLREALARDEVARERARGHKHTKREARQAVEAMIQNVHHFRDDCLRQLGPPIEHVAVFDEAQRAWNKEQTSAFMRRKRGQASFDVSEAEFLLSCLDRHSDWAVVICLVGGGQEIHTGEAGISAWIEALLDRFPQWQLHLPGQLRESEYAADRSLARARQADHVFENDQLHLGTSMRSFRASGVSEWVRTVLDLEVEFAKVMGRQVLEKFPIVLTRDLATAKRWLRARARGTERVGLVVSSQALRLKPHAIDVRAPVDPVHWFLNGEEDVRSSCFLEDAATEFQVQGLELDWTCLVWDADYRQTGHGWEHWSFVGDSWQRVRKSERQAHLKNAYRVLLTRARQGMAIVVPVGQAGDHTRQPAFYDGTFDYLKGLGLPLL